MVLRSFKKFHAFEVSSILWFRFGIEKADEAFADIQRCIIKSMKAVQKLVSNSHHSF